MATTHEIQAEVRGNEGKGASRRLRREGMVPAVLYGAKQDAQAIQLTQKNTQLYAAHEWFYSTILHMQINGASQKVLLRDIQRHPFKPIVMHLDFQRVSETEKLRLKVPLHFLNQEKSPAGKLAGVTILHEVNEVEIFCLPKDIPDALNVDLIDLKLNEIMHLSDLKLPEGVTIPSLKLGKEHDHAVVIAKEIKAVEEIVAAADAAAVPASAVKAPAKGAAAAKGAAPAKGAAAAKGAAPAKGAAAAKGAAPAKKK